MENKRHHLDMIQRVIDRMAGNLFLLKGWTVTLIAALSALAAKDVNQKYIFVAIAAVLIFWILDGYYLSQERRFRDLYDAVRKLGEKDIDFSMDTRKFEKTRYNKWITAMFSSTLRLFYLSLIMVIAVVSYWIN